MSVSETALSAAEITRWFIAAAPPPANTFEMALVLGGTVSAGAYTAGAVDFLIEALDCWTGLRDADDPSAPRHRAVLKIVTGTSGGGVNAAIAARALAYDYPHVVRATPNPERGTGNPFYDLWVNRLNLAGFLGTEDVAAGSVVSLLSGKPIDDAAAYIAGYGAFAPQLAPRPVTRSYIADPLRVILTLTNLSGMPYKVSLGAPSLSETFVDHADYVRFAVVYPGRSLAEPRPDEFVVGFADARLPQAVDWAAFGRFAQATCAFPLGFPPRALVRPLDHYRYRVVVLPGDGTRPARVVGRQPDWAQLTPAGAAAPPSDYHFLAVDGGATDNEPIELARTALAGVLGRDPRDPKTADRAVMLIDPFAGKAGLGPAGPTGLVNLVGAIGSTFIEQTRYDSQDLLLAADPDVFSRFMITPQRDGRTGGDALASAGLGAFIGFACAAFMRHDYLLGRANCQRYLGSEFVLHEANPIFANGVWSEAQKQTLGIVADGERFLPVIPLLGDAAVPETPEPWPRHQLDPKIYADAIEARFKGIVESEGGGLIGSSIAWLVAQLGEAKAADLVISRMTQALTAAGLD
ncbi:MAG TPA: patatin-like phospholipase family protein [Stellaceae bacterium]|nr:patatin-like phospholipase family protein [Stellaceae bacterium]